MKYTCPPHQLLIEMNSIELGLTSGEKVHDQKD